MGEGMRRVNFATNIPFFQMGRWQKNVRMLLLVLIALTAIQCAHPPPAPPNDQFFDVPAAPPVVTLAPGDVIDVKFYYTPEMNESQMIRPDGKIALQLLGDVAVTGKTPDQLRRDLIKSYTVHLKNPEVAVIIRSMNDRRVYVGGEVNHPGMIALPGSMTVLEAIMSAGGFNMTSAKPQNVVIIRFHEGKWRGRSVDLTKTLSGEEGALAQLAPRDIVFVPRTKINSVDQWVDQYINKLIPSIVSSAGGYVFGQWLINNTK
jgi:protein involved in polysaccharide export with SLBB domain